MDPDARTVSDLGCCHYRHRDGITDATLVYHHPLCDRASCAHAACRDEATHVDRPAVMQAPRQENDPARAGDPGPAAAAETAEVDHSCIHHEDLDRTLDQLAEEQKETERYRLALESLTVGGSEFYKNPDYCVAHVRDRIRAADDRWRRAGLKANSLRDQLAAALTQIETYRKALNPPPADKGERSMEWLNEALNSGDGSYKP